jgi:hypothetical protein
LAAQAAPKPARLHLVTSDQLYELGIELMDDAEPSSSVHQGDAFRYRDGLIIALLAVAPLRRGTLAALRVGEHLLRSGDLWVLEIPAKDMKTRQSLDFLLSAPLSALGTSQKVESFTVRSNAARSRRARVTMPSAVAEKIADLRNAAGHFRRECPRSD